MKTSSILLLVLNISFYNLSPALAQIECDLNDSTAVDSLHYPWIQRVDYIDSVYKEYLPDRYALDQLGLNNPQARTNLDYSQVGTRFFLPVRLHIHVDDDGVTNRASTDLDALQAFDDLNETFRDLGISLTGPQGTYT